MRSHNGKNRIRNFAKYIRIIDLKKEKRIVLQQKEIVITTTKNLDKGLSDEFSIKKNPIVYSSYKLQVKVVRKAEIYTFEQNY